MVDKEMTSLPESRVREGAKELHELSRTYNTPEGLMVRARCYALRRNRRVRFEILVDGFGQYAIVDVTDRKDLALRMSEAMDAFAASARLRGVTAVYVG
jgi:hypothetical protein